MEKDWRVFSAHRKLILLAKYVLDLLEDLEDSNKDRRQKLELALEQSSDKELLSAIVDLYDPLSDSFFNQSRKRVLDKANELSREFEKECKR